MDEAMLRFNEKLKQLLDVAKKKKNVLEYTEINQFFSDMELSTEKIELIYEYLEQNGVDILTIPQDDDDDADIADLADIEDDIDIDAEMTSALEGVSIEDPVRMYLKEIGKVPLLSAEDEIEFAQKMENGVVAKEKIAILKKRETDDEDEARENEEEIYSKISVVEFLIYRACRKSFEYMIPDDHECGYTPEAVKDCIVSFRC
jgi:RNA polymerase primary sigma factor